MRKLGQVAYPTLNPDPKATPSYSYLIVDVGGGTVDVSAHRVSTTPTLSVDELHRPVGNGWGGLQVNAKFSEFLQKTVDDRLFRRYLHTGDTATRITNRFDLDDLLNITFEKKKKIYCRAGQGEREDVLVKLPDRFLNQYRGALVTSLEGQTKQLHVEGRDNEVVTLRDSTLRIPPAKMETFLQPAVAGITECIDGLLASLTGQGEEVDVIYRGMQLSLRAVLREVWRGTGDHRSSEPRVCHRGGGGAVQTEPRSSEIAKGRRHVREERR